MTGEKQHAPNEVLYECELRLQQTPNDTNVLYEMGCALQSLRRFEEAARPFETILQLEPNDHETMYALAKALAKLGRFDESVSHLEKAIALWPREPTYHAELGEALIALGQNDRARDALQAGLQYTLPNEEVEERLIRTLESI